MSTKRIYCTVTTDLTYDQRMIRICTSLAKVGYDVFLVGCKIKKSRPLQPQVFKQDRIFCFFSKGKLFYVEYNIRLFFFLFFRKMDAVCAIDLDTIIPCYFISKIKKAKRIYDAHELFCEMKEVVTRPGIYKFWKRIEKFTVIKFEYGYTVNQSIANEFYRMYGVKYEVIRNMPFSVNTEISQANERFILYQGAVNEGRSFETLIPAMKYVDCKLIICGEGNFFEQARELVRWHQLDDKIIFKGRVAPDELRKITQQAYMGVTLFENKGLSNYYSLGNRFFDYIQAGIPQLCVGFPEYELINKQYNIAYLITDLSSESIAQAINKLLKDSTLYAGLKLSCAVAGRELCWEKEEEKLINFYRKVLN